MIHPSRIDRIRTGLARGRGVLIIGPEFTRSNDHLDLNRILDAAFEEITDSTGWDSLDFEDRTRLCLQSLGNGNFARLVCAHMPSVHALESHLSPFHRNLLNTPFPHIIDLNIHEIVRAGLNAMNESYRYLACDSDLVTRPDSIEGERTVIKLRGDCWHDEAAFTVEELAHRLQANPALRDYCRQVLKQGPTFIYGFSPRCSVLRLLNHLLGAFSGSSLFATRVDSVLWRRHWNQQGVELVDSGTYSELEPKVDSIMATLRADFEFSDMLEVDRKLTDLVAQQFVKCSELEWIHRIFTDRRLIQDFDDLDLVRKTILFLVDCHQRGLTIPAFPAAFSAEMSTRLGDPALGRIALKLAIQRVRSAQPFDAPSMGAIGRTLIRMGDADRAQFYLRAALHKGEIDLVRQADDLAWLSRCMVDKMDSLRSKGRSRAAMELIARFLQANSQFMNLVELDAEPNSELLRSIYYINLRLGRIMAVAASMADTSGDVYAQKACELLNRAIEIEPAKPDAYKAIRPLMTEREYQTANSKKWMALVASAPSSVQRRLGGR